MKYVGFENGLIERCYSLLAEIAILKGTIKNVENDRDSKPIDTDQITIENSYVVTHRGVKTQKWVDSDGNWHEKIIK